MSTSIATALSFDRLGWSADRARAFAPHTAAGLVPGRLVSSTGDGQALTEAGPTDVIIQRRFAREAESRLDLPAVGDWLALEPVSEQPRQAALREVLQQGRHRLVCPLALPDKAGVEAFARRSAVGVPAPVEKLHEPDAALDEATGQEAVVGEGGRAWFGAVGLPRPLRLAGEVSQFGDCHLHAEGQLVLRDTGGDLGIIDRIVVALVHPLEEIELAPA